MKKFRIVLIHFLGFQTGNNSTKFLFKGDESQPYDFLSNRFFEKEFTPANTEPVVPVVELNIRQVPGKFNLI